MSILGENIWSNVRAIKTNLLHFELSQGTVNFRKSLLIGVNVNHFVGQETQEIGGLNGVYSF